MLLLFSETSPCPADTSTNSSEEESTSSQGKQNITLSNIPKLVKHMEKSLSQAQRDQFLMSTAKGDLLMKKDILQAFERSYKTLHESISKMTTCLTSIGEGISSGMRMVAMALANQTGANSLPAHHTQQHCLPRPQFGSYGNFTAHSTVAHNTHYTANRDVFPSSQFHCIENDQGNGQSSPRSTGPLFVASQVLFDTDSNDNSYNY